MQLRHYKVQQNLIIQNSITVKKKKQQLLNLQYNKYYINIKNYIIL